MKNIFYFMNIVVVAFVIIIAIVLDKLDNTALGFAISALIRLVSKMKE